jgi:hypothetical protein
LDDVGLMTLFGSVEETEFEAEAVPFASMEEAKLKGGFGT